MKWSDFDDYLTADHLGGKAFTLEIKEVVTEEFYDQSLHMKEAQPVLHFKGTDKGMIVRGPNRKALKALFGDDVAACVGKKVMIRAERAIAFGKEHWPVRIFEATATNGHSNPTEIPQGGAQEEPPEPLPT